MTLPSSKPSPSLPPAPTAPARSSTPLISPFARSPYLSWSLSSLLLAAVPATVRNPIGFPHLVQLPGFAMIFAGTGYMIHSGDSVNGAGTATAWSLIYLFLHAKSAVVARRPLPVVLAGAVGVLGAGVEGWDYFVNS